MGVKIREKFKGSDEWWIFINHNGRRKAKKVGTKKAAEKARQTIEARLALGQPVEQRKPLAPTLNQYYERFKTRYMETALKESTYVSYESVFKVHILPALGSFRLNEIDREKIEDFIYALVKKNLGKYTINQVIGTLRLLLNNAIEKKIITENPASGVGKLYRHAPVIHGEIEPLTEEESVLFLKSALEWGPRHYPLFLCALHTGLRSGEVIAIQWPDIDWNGKFIEIRRQLVRGKLTTLKTKHGRRRVDLSDDLLSTLANLKKKLQEEALKRGCNEISEWVWANKKGHRIDIDRVKKLHFKRALRKAGLRNIRFHDLRHTYASLLLSRGVPVVYVSQQLGHSTPNITFSIYAHWIPNENQREAVNRLPSINSFSQRSEVSGELEK